MASTPGRDQTTDSPGGTTYGGEARISTVFALLPTSLQTRITPLRHIRRSISLGSLQTDGLSTNDDPDVCRPHSEGSIAPMGSADERYDPAATRDLQIMPSERRVVHGPKLSDEDQLRSQTIIRRRFARQGKPGT